MKLLWIKITIALVVVAAGVLGVARFLEDPDFSVKKLYVVGRVEGSSLAEVEAAVANTNPGHILFADIEAVRSAVADLSWVKNVRVVRVWPDGLRIDIDRYEAVAIWEDGRLVAPDGRLFTTNDESIERLAQMPMFSGDPAYAAQAASYLTQFREAVATVDARLKAVHVSYRGSWSVTAESQSIPPVTIELGRAFTEATPVEKLQRVMKYFKHTCNVLRGYPQRIDARYRDAFAAQLPNRASVQQWVRDNAGVTTMKGDK